jgi:hypothetical protein
MMSFIESEGPLVPSSLEPDIPEFRFRVADLVQKKFYWCPVTPTTNEIIIPLWAAKATGNGI